VVSAVSVSVPTALVTIALVDGVFAGFRAATGRDGHIRKRAYYRGAMRRGLVAGATALGCVAVVVGIVLTASADRTAVFTDLTHAGTAMLWVTGPYAVAVLISLVGYVALPRRPATFLTLLGLGPFTIIRPWIAVAAGLTAAWVARDLAIAGCAFLAVAGVLAVEPYVHRRWYAEPR
jgi:hypothetical protein